MLRKVIYRNHLMCIVSYRYCQMQVLFT